MAGGHLQHDRPDRPARFELMMGVGGSLQREPGVDPGNQIPAGSSCERLLGVIDLTSRAMVNRAAFYRNYRDKYDLVEQIFDEAMAEMTADDEGDTRSPGQRFAGFLGHIDTYHRLYGALLGRKGSPWFADRMRSALAATSSEHLPGRDADALAPSVISAMFVQSIRWWLEHGRPCPPDELAEQSSRLIRAVIVAAAR